MSPRSRVHIAGARAYQICLSGCRSIGGPHVRSGLSSDFGIYTARVNNDSPARKKDEFANSDAEKWFAFRRLLEKREVILPVDGELLKQLSGRRLQYDSKARIQLEPKELMRSRGLSSPDRADAVIGATVMSLPGVRAVGTRRYS